jgi:hypothetical protein
LASGTITPPPGFELEQSSGSPPEGFELEGVQKKTTPPAAKPEPTYTGEILKGAGRALEGLITYPFEAAKLRKGEEGGTGITRTNIGPTGRVLLHTGEDIIHGLEAGKAARDKAKAAGEGVAGQTLSTLENYPVIGPIVKKAEEAGPGYAKLKPQTLGATAEGATMVAAPAAVGKAISSTYGVKYRGEQLIEKQVAQHADAPVETSAIEGVFDKISDLAKHAHNVPAIVKQVMNSWDSIKNAKAEPAPGGGTIESAAPKGITFGDLVKLRRALDTKLWGEGEIKSKTMEGLAKKLRHTMDVEEYKTLHRSGTPADVQEYAQGKKFYRRGIKVQQAGRVVGGGVGTVGGILGGAEAARSTGVPYGGWIGGSLGGPVGAYAGRELGGRAATAWVEAGKPSGGMSAGKQAAAEMRAEKASSVKAAQEFGQPSMSHIDLDAILRRSKLPEAEQAKIRAVIEQNETMRRQRDLPKDPDAPTPEIMARGKAAYEQKYGKPKAPEAKAKPSSWTEAPRHNDAIAQAKKELGASADIRAVLKRADEIEREGRK